MFPFLSQFEQQWPSPSGIVAAVFLTGFALAYATDDADHFHEFVLAPRKVSTGSNIECLKQQPSLTEPLNIISHLIAYIIGRIASLLDYTYTYALVVDHFNKIKKKINLYKTGLYLKKIAKSKRHLFYLLEKTTLNLDISPTEDEIDSYLDCKRSIGRGWPFMWIVADVKSPLIKCDQYPCKPMSSYSYLGLLSNEEVQQSALDAAKKWATGNHGPRMLGGNMRILVDLEKIVANFFGREGALLCATGYLSTMSAVAAVSVESTVLFADSRIHASLRAGLKIGEGKYHFFKHNNFKVCEELILKHRKKYHSAWMIIESVYSMDGDICDLPAAYALCQKYDIKLLIDEAHGLGVLGKTGRGAEEHFNLEGCATIICGTFSKSIASVGGYITGPKRYIDYFDFHAPGNVFSAPLTAYSAGAAMRSFQLIDERPEIITKAQYNAKRLRELFKCGANMWPADYPEDHKYLMEGDPATTVIPIIFKDDMDRVMRVATRLKEFGYMCSAVAYPACPLRTPRFRITATSVYTEELMAEFVKSFVQICVEEKPSLSASLFQ